MMAMQNEPDQKEFIEALIERHLVARYDRATRVTEIAVTVCLDIVRGDLRAGSELNSVGLAERFSSSRTPVREALMLLEKEGLVDLPPRRRPLIAAHDFSDIREDYQLRLILMPEVMSSLIESASNAEISALKFKLRTMRNAADRGALDAYFWSNVDFHETALVCTHNSALKAVLSGLFLRALRFRYLGMMLPGRVERSCEDHTFLMQAIERRDAELASAIIRSNLRGALEAIEAQHERAAFLSSSGGED